MVCTLIDVMWPLSHNHLIWLDRLIGIAVAKDLILIPIQTSGCSSFPWRRQRRRRCRPCPPQRSPHASPAETYPKFGPLLFYIKMCQKGHNWAKFEAHPFDRIWMNGLSDHPHLPALLPESILWETDLLSNRRKNLLRLKKKLFVLLTLGCWILTIGLAVRRNKTQSARKISADLPLQIIQFAPLTQLDLLILSSKVSRNQCHFVESDDWVVLVRTNLFHKGTCPAAI